MNQLPPLLARDYRRSIIWPRALQLAASLAIGLIAIIVFGFLP